MQLDAWHFVLAIRNETILRRLLARLSNEARPKVPKAHL